MTTSSPALTRFEFAMDKDSGSAEVPLIHQTPPSHRREGSADGEVAAVVVEEVGGGKAGASAAPVSLYQHFRQLPGSSRSMLMLVFGVGFACTCLSSVVVAMNPETFATGRLTGVQMCFLTLSFSSLAMRAVLLVGAWDAAPSPAFSKQVAAVSEIGVVLLIFYLCDRTTIIPRREKKYDADFFAFLVICLAVAGAFTLRQVPKKPAAAKAAPLKPQAEGNDKGGDGVAKQPESTQKDEAEAAGHHAHGEVIGRPPSQTGLLMNRHQTDEWKGWMQMLFLWYHYFHNVSIYNEIRVFIAAYIWMTGFGNFTYYYNREDFSLHRFLGMMWRLNFFVVCVCGVLRNEYMLYYICPLHTLFTLAVYLVLLVKHSLNRNRVFLGAKTLLCVVACFLLWDAPFAEELFRTVFLPVTPLVAYHDVVRPERDIFGEWFFRTFLDHYVWIVGMVVAYAYPTIEAWLRRLDDAAPGAARLQAVITKWIISISTMIILAIYSVRVLSLPKKDYSALHPYTSAIPLLGFLILRNISQRVRGYYVGLFEWLGKITLETYIAQFHVWMATTGLNGSPKLLLRIIPGEYPMCDFLLSSAFMFLLSYRVAAATETTKSIVFPQKASNRVLFANLTGLICVCASITVAHVAWNVAVFHKVS